MDSFDAVMIPLLETLGRAVYQGRPPHDPDDVNRVQAEVPYLLYGSGIGNDPMNSRRMAGRASRREIEFRVTYVAIDPSSAKIVGEAVRDLLDYRIVAPAGRKAWRIRCVDSQRVREDPMVHIPEGHTLWYGIDDYITAVTQVPVPA